MHDPVDQPSDSASSAFPCARDQRSAPEYPAAVPVIQLDHAPAIEPAPNVDEAAQSPGALGRKRSDGAHLVTPTMWR